jgi:HlyD family secretion protein
MKPWTKRLAWIALAAALGWLVARALRTMPVIVDVATIKRTTLTVTADDDGRTRVRERYTISAPIGGRLLRTALEPGDVVLAGETLVAEFDHVAPSLLDARQRGEAEARVRRAEAALQVAEARREQAEVDLAFADKELARVRGLVESGVQPGATLDRAERDQRSAFQGARAAAFALQVARFEHELSQASLVEPVDGDVAPPHAELNGKLAADGRLLLRSPIDGHVLRVFEESARTMASGTPILEVGNTGALEIVADYLSQDAVKVEPGMPVVVEGWGGELPGGAERELRGRVRVVEPGGFTKVSALGVEEQRVVIVVDPVGDEDQWARLGDGYHVELRIELWTGDDRLVVPSGALFREAGGWRVFVVEGDRAVKRDVELGRATGLEAEVRNGLAEGERVVLYPGEATADGTRIEVR